MPRLRSLFGRILFGARHWTQGPIQQSPTAPSVMLMGLPRERALAGVAEERTLRASAMRERGLTSTPAERSLTGRRRCRALKPKETP